MSKLFKGIEIEGRFRGNVTLFVEGMVDNVLEKAKSDPDINHIYFGARYKSFVLAPSEYDSAEVYKCSKEYITSVEIDARWDCRPYWEPLLPSALRPYLFPILLVDSIFDAKEFCRKYSKESLSGNISFKLGNDNSVILFKYDTIVSGILTTKSEYELVNDILIQES